MNRGSATGPRGGQVGGATITGPQGNTVGRAVGVGPAGAIGTAGGVQGAGGGTAARGTAVGPGGTVGTVRGVQGAGGGTAIRGAAVGPGGRAVAGGAVRGPNGGAAARGIAVGPQGVAAGFARVTPSGRYTTAAAVRTHYNHWGVYGTGWYTQYPGAWFAAGWATGAVWRAAAWGTAAPYCGYASAPPVYYDYGDNITYEDNSVYVNGDNVGTSEEYYDQAADLASAGEAADTLPDGDWLPLGVYALTQADMPQTDQPKADISIQLAINKDGIIRGNYTDSAKNENQVVQGSLEKETQRVAFTVGDNTTDVFETGLYNLTKDEAPALLHHGKDSTEQLLLVRLQKPANAGN